MGMKLNILYLTSPGIRQGPAFLFGVPEGRDALSDRGGGLRKMPGAYKRVEQM